MAQKSAKGEVSESERRKHVDLWQQSDLEKDDFCRQQGITANQLSYWQRVLGKGEGIAGKKASAFARVVARPATASVLPALAAAAVRLLVGGGAVLEIDGSVDPIWAARVISAVGGRQ